jgi:uncharacterized protein
MIIIHAVNTPHTYLKRLLADTLRRALTSSPAVVLTGARQSGKSTLVQHLGEHSHRTYVSLDDVDTLDLASRDPDALALQEGPITFDEVQRSPSLLLAVKRAIDRHRSPGRFLLTGSANLLMMKRIGESLAGRAVYLTLYPFARHELDGNGRAGVWSALFSVPAARWLDQIFSTSMLPGNWKSLARIGGYPIPALQLDNDEDRALWFTGYARTYLERDVQDIGGISSLVDFRRLMRVVALRLGTVLNQTEVARDVGLSQPTVHRHLNVLEASYQLVRVPAYSVNRTKRLIKAPKVYWTDTGLALHLAGEKTLRGAHLENLLFSELLTWQSVAGDPEIMYWRTTTGEEVDFVIEWEGRLLPIEVKTTQVPRLSDARHLLTFRREYRKDSLPALLIHTGSETRWLADGILAVPWWKLF